MARLAQAPERRATFEEEKRLAVLDQPLRGTGTLLYRRPRYLEKRTTYPAPESLVVDGDRLVLTTGNEPPRVVDLGGQPEIRALVDTVRGVLSGDLPALQRLYGIQAEGGPSAWRLTLTPTDPRAARFLRVVRVQGAADEVRSIEVVEAGGDTQLLRITPAP